MEMDLLQEVEDMIVLQAEKGKVLFEHNCQGCENCCIMTDKTQVVRILVNILSNAVKFTAANGKVEFFTAVKRLSPAKIQHTYRISDTGCGMSQEFLNKMYQPFEQEQSRHVVDNGTGLGLFITRSLIQLLGGTIDCTSKIGQGTTFTVTLIYDIATAAEQTKADNNKGLDLTPLKGKKILLCDDHEINRDSARIILEKQGMTVVCADNGQQAVALFAELSEREFDAILMDIRMPVMDGIQATMKIRSYIRKNAKTIPIIALTADAQSAEKQTCLEAGMNAHLTKPIEPLELYKTLIEFLN